MPEKNSNSVEKKMDVFISGSVFENFSILTLIPASMRRATMDATRRMMIFFELILE